MRQGFPDCVVRKRIQTKFVLGLGRGVRCSWYFNSNPASLFFVGNCSEQNDDPSVGVGGCVGAERHGVLKDLEGTREAP